MMKTYTIKTWFGNYPFPVLLSGIQSKNLVYEKLNRLSEMGCEGFQIFSDTLQSDGSIKSEIIDIGFYS